MCNSCGKRSNNQSKRRKASNKKKDKCPDNEVKNKEPPKCPIKKRLANKPKKCLTRIEKIMMRIQPSIADRERYLHPEHVNCFLEPSERVNIKKPAHGFYPSQRPKVCAEDKKNKRNKSSDHDVEDRKNKDGKTGEKKIEKETDEEKDVGSDNAEGKAEGGEKSGEGKKKVDRKEAGQQIERNKKKKKQKKRAEKKIEDNSDSEMSICSIDSEVCLVGLGLTREDKRMIEENRRKVHPPPADEDRTDVGEDNDVPDATEEENEQTETKELIKEEE